MSGFQLPAGSQVIVLLVSAVLGTVACDRVYYSTMKRFGMEKRDILVDRVRDAQKAQTAAKEEFQTALERFKAVIEVEDSSLEKKYQTLSKELERSDTTSSGDESSSDDFFAAKRRVVDAFERDYLAGKLKAAGGKLTHAAKAAGVERNYFRRLLRKHGLARAADDDE